MLLIFSSNLHGQLSNSEYCGNGYDDDNDGLIDEDCSICSNNHDKIWYFGNGVGLDFNSGTPVLLNNGQTNVLEGCATVSNANGELLFYSDGRILSTGTAINFTSHHVIECNKISGDANAFLSYLDLNGFTLNNQNNDNFGLRAYNIEGRYACNQFDQVPTALQVNGNCFGAIFLGNRFGLVSRGIWFLDGAYTGTQSHFGNRWTIANPFNNLITNTVSQFNVVGAINEDASITTFNGSYFLFDRNANPEFEPFSVATPNVPPFVQWFIQAPSSNTYNCNNTPTCANPVPLVAPPVLEVFEQSVIAGSYQGHLFPKTELFTANATVYKKLKQYPSFAPLGSAAAAFEANLATECEGKFYDISTLINDLYKIPTGQQQQLDLLTSQIESNRSDLMLLDSLWLVDTNNRVAIETSIQSTTLGLQSLEQQYLQLSNSIYQSRCAFADAIEVQNTAIQTNSKVERNIQTVNSIYLKTFAKGIFKFDNQQQNKLDKIARQCPLDGGAIVHQARSMMTFFSRLNYEALEDCTPRRNATPNRREGEIVEMPEVKVYPNPTANQVTIAWRTNEILDKPNPTGQLLIYNNLGQLLIQQTIQGASGQETLSLEQYPSGLYICKLYLDGQELHQEKLIIAK